MDFWLKAQAEQNSKGIFIDDGVKQITFGKMYDSAKRLAYSLKQLELNRIGLYINNTIESIVLINAAWVAGIEIAMVNTRLTKKEMIAQMKSIDVSTIITMEQLHLRDIEVIDFQTLQTQEGYEFEAPFSNDRIASIMFTSGTTGPQKAVPRTF